MISLETEDLAQTSDKVNLQHRSPTCIVLGSSEASRKFALRVNADFCARLLAQTWIWSRSHTQRRGLLGSISDSKLHRSLVLHLKCCFCGACYFRSFTSFACFGSVTPVLGLQHLVDLRFSALTNCYNLYNKGTACTSSAFLLVKTETCLPLAV